MGKDFIQSDNYFVAESMNSEPEVQVDNYFDENDGGFKITTSIDLGEFIVNYTKTLVKSLLPKERKRVSCPDFEISEIDLIDKKKKFYKVSLFKSIDLTEEEFEFLQSRNEEEMTEGGQA